ncbi:MAG: L-histidine N(alpha)-methyltransferase, partial [Elusimicrobia bacterium]|nr:L-histidine N(alpha)-methyltransferase [Elusimicrobiota bacterium]
MTTNNLLFDETIKYLEKESGTNKFYLTQPHLLYLSDEQSDDYLKLMANSKYHGKFHAPTLSIVEDNIDSIARHTKNQVSLIDLGPGFPDKSLPIIKYLKSKNIATRYYPVDVNEKFLKIASNEMNKYADEVIPIHKLFKDCKNNIPPDIYDNQDILVMLGLTFMNFNSLSIINILKEIAKQKGRIIIAAELITTEGEIKDILSSYEVKEAEKFAFGPLANLCFKQDEVSYNVSYLNSRVELSFLINKDPM